MNLICALLFLASIPFVLADLPGTDDSRDRWECKWRGDVSKSPSVEQGFDGSKYNADKWKIFNYAADSRGYYTFGFVNYKISIKKDAGNVRDSFAKQFVTYANTIMDPDKSNPDEDYMMPSGYNCSPLKAGQPSDTSDESYGSEWIFVDNPFLTKPDNRPWIWTECGGTNQDPCPDNGAPYEMFGCRITCKNLPSRPDKPYGDQVPLTKYARCEIGATYSPPVDDNSKTTYECGLEGSVYGSVAFAVACEKYGGKPDRFNIPKGYGDPDQGY